MLKERIAGALGVSQATITEDLRHLSAPDKSGSDRGKDKLGRKKSTGRPKGSTKKDVGAIVCSPAAAQLSISSKKPKRTNRDDHKAEQGRLATQACRARKKQRNPVTKRLDPVSILKLPLPYSVYRHIDAAAIKILDGNPRDADGKPITFEQARVLVTVDIVTAAFKKGGPK
jgi:hypothetical protein